jgi:adenylate cyclase
LPDKPSIAVLPFTNMSGDPEQEYFSDGITEDIITELSKFHELFVIARNSSFVYRDRGVDVRQVGRQLGVRHILEGSVRKAGSRVRVTAQLVDATTGDHLWAERYDRDLGDIFAVQDEVTQTIVATLTERLKYVIAERAKRKPPAELEAYEYVLRGRELFHRWNSEDNHKARDMFVAAVELDPNYGVAHAYLAMTHYADWIGGWSRTPDETLERFFDLSEQSLGLDDADATSHDAVALAYLYRHQHDEARFHAEKAFSLNPNDADVVMCLGYVAMFDGKHDEAIDRVDQAARLNPFGRFGAALGMALFSAKRYDEAVASLKTVRGKLPHANAFLAASYAHTGAEEESRNAAAQLVKVAWSQMTKVGAPIPESWSVFLTERFPFRHQADLNHLLEGLRKAGVPN